MRCPPLLRCFVCNTGHQVPALTCLASRLTLHHVCWCVCCTVCRRPTLWPTSHVTLSAVLSSSGGGRRHGEQRPGHAIEQEDDLRFNRHANQRCSLSNDKKETAADPFIHNTGIAAQPPDGQVPRPQQSPQLATDQCHCVS